MTDTTSRRRSGFIAIAPKLVGRRPDKTAEIVARDIVSEIIVAGRQPGDSLESEQAMLDRYEVSRESLREGLRLLEVQGLISIRRGPGGGARVGTVDPADLGRTSSLFFHMAGATYAELLEAYTFAEAALARLAAGNDDAEMRRSAMEPYLVDQHLEDELDRYVELHAGFHSRIASLADNRVLEISLQSLGLLVARHYTALADARRSSPFVGDDHAAIARAVIAGHQNKAHDLMIEHVTHVIEVMKRDGLDEDAVITWV